MKMRKNISIVLGALLISTAFVGISMGKNGENTIVLNFNFTPPTLGVSSAGKEFTHISMADLSNGGNSGSPYLPIKPLYILLPYKTRVSGIDVTAKDTKFIGNAVVEPAPQPFILGEKPVPTTINNTIYNSSNPFPHSLYEKVGIQKFRGYNILVINLYPVRYIPKTGELYYYSSMTVKVYLKRDNTANNLYRGFEKDRKEVLKKVDNPKEIYTYPIKKDKAFHEFVIITTDSLNISGDNTFQDLADYRSSNGIDTVVVTVEDIENNPQFWNTSYPMFNDTQAQIRNFIRYAYQNWGTDYVLLGGDADDGNPVVPVRKLYVYGSGYTTYMPSDLYYACLDGSYNSDMDGKWGEPNDGPNGGDVDLIAEVWVGRARVDSQDEMENFVQKTIGYQESGGEYISNVWLLGEYLGFGGVAEWGGNYKDEFVDYSDAHGYFTFGFPSEMYNITKLYDRDDSNHDWPVSELINAIDSSSIHLINHLGHANEYYNMKMDTSDVDSLTNTKYFFAYSQGCDAGAFDYNDCIAEHFTVSSHGAFGGVWNARYGWGASYSTDGPSQRYDREFWDAIYGENITEIGHANQDSKEDNLYRINEDLMRWCYYETNLFGDPTVRIKGTGSDVQLSYDPHVYNFGVVEEGQTYQTTFEIWNSGDGTLTYTLNENYGWLSCNPTSGSSTGEHDVITVTIDTTGLGGTYNGYIYISSNGGGGVFQVMFYIPSGAQLSYNPASYNFGVVEEGQTYQTTFEIWNSGDGTLNWQLSDSYNWLTYVPENGQNTPFDPHDVVTVYVDTTGLLPGTYTGEININSNGGSGNFSVTFTIPGPILSYSPDFYDFGNIVEGESSSMQFEIWNSGIDTLYYSITDYSNWVDVNPTSGSSTGEHDTITVTINTIGLYEGYHSCNIYINSNGGAGTVSVEVYVVQNTIQFGCSLLSGWNFVTIACENNYTASSLYNNISGCNLILKWNNSRNDFDVYVPGSPNNFAIENGIGYFISVSNNTNLSVTGMPIARVNITLLQGWNSLGWFEEEQTNASNIYNSIAGCNLILKWNNSKDDFDVYVPNAPDFVIEQGNGFFVSVSQQSQWHG